LLFAGLIQPDSGQWGLVDVQAQLIARYLAALDRNLPAATRFNALKSQGGTASHGIRYVSSPRHLLEVEHFGYRRQLEKQLDQF
jgi:hypothetical protein